MHPESVYISSYVRAFELDDLIDVFKNYIVKGML